MSTCFHLLCCFPVLCFTWRHTRAISFRNPYNRLAGLPKIHRQPVSSSGLLPGFPSPPISALDFLALGHSNSSSIHAVLMSLLADKDQLSQEKRLMQRLTVLDCTTDNHAITKMLICVCVCYHRCCCSIDIL